MSFSEYAQFYDLYYAEKDYGTEVDFVLTLASKFNVSVKTLLDMGCGTGKHLAEFVKRGIDCDGFDRSQEMLLHSQKRLGKTSVNLSLGCLTSFENGKRYDLVVSLFAVMGYLVENANLISGLKTAAKHLNTNGIFVFDGWFGPAVLYEKPEVREHIYQNDNERVVRRAEPIHNPVTQTVTVNYNVDVTNKGTITTSVNENHAMRYMFVQEMRLAMDKADLTMIHCCPFLDFDGELSERTWNVTFVCKRKDNERCL